MASYGQSNAWLTCLLVDPKVAGAGREDLRLHLEDHDIESRPTWKPLHLQPAYRDAPTVGGRVAEAIFDHGLCLPSGSGLTPDQQDRVIALLLERLGR